MNIDTSTPERFFHDVLEFSFHDVTGNFPSIEQLSSIAYVSGVFADFVEASNLINPDSLPEDLDTISARFIVGMGDRKMRKYVADTVLFYTTMFPQNLRKRGAAEFYEELVPINYGLLSRSSLPRFQPYESLSTHFSLYKNVITHARNNYMTFENTTGGISCSSSTPRLNGIMEA